jgi:hypothetical protein
MQFLPLIRHDPTVQNSGIRSYSATYFLYVILEPSMNMLYISLPVTGWSVWSINAHSLLAGPILAKRVVGRNGGEVRGSSVGHISYMASAVQAEAHACIEAVNAVAAWGMVKNYRLKLIQRCYYHTTCTKEQGPRSWHLSPRLECRFIFLFRIIYCSVLLYPFFGSCLGPWIFPEAACMKVWFTVTWEFSSNWILIMFVFHMPHGPEII